MTASATRAGVLLGAWVTLAAFAQAPDTHYEDALVEWGLSREGRQREPSPEGKVVDAILIDSEEIVAPSDPYPSILNIIHARTRPSVIRHEVLLPVGSVYRRDLAEETERNLRGLFVLAIARVVPVKSAKPGAVSLLIVTKDLWSIRLNSQFNLVGSLLQYLRIEPTEQNFLGMDKQVSLDFQLRLDTVAFGEAFTDPRVLGTFLNFTEQFDVFFNRATGAGEGTTGAVSFGLPLYSLDTPWSYGISGSWTVDTARVFRGADIWQLPYPNAQGPSGTVPYVYDQRVVSASAQITRSLGHDFKNNFSLSIGGYTNVFAAPGSEPITSDQRAWLAANYLPLSESAIYVLGSIHSFEARYAVIHNLESFSLSEDWQLGHSVLLEARWADPAFLSPTRFGDLAASLRYRWLWHDDLLSLEAAGAIRYRPGATGSGLDGPWVNRHVAAEVLNATPFIGIGRVILHGVIDVRADDLNHTQVLLGGGDGLRGVAPEALVGTSEVLFNLEYRTRPISFHTLHAGLVFFWDAGSAFVTRPSLVHTIGIGIRTLFPQFDISPLRIDVGWVINAPNPGLLNQTSASFGQIEGYRPAFLDTPL